jgi:hypothetical protein
MGPPPVMPWGGSPAAKQHWTWSSSLPPGGYWPPPLLSGYWPPLPPIGHPGQSSSTTPPPFGYGYSAMGTSSWRATPAVGNASVDDTDTTAVATFFFTTDGKSFIPTFNYSIHNMSKCQTSRILIHFCLQASFIIGWTRIRRWGPKHGRVR